MASQIKFPALVVVSIVNMVKAKPQKHYNMENPDQMIQEKLRLQKKIRRKAQKRILPVVLKNQILT
ncbi:MAG: hypothetical protein EBQ89_04255 [Alphaproteobacteria bacterium]|nr:hypothetical protein [Alphaproteobacteria bacterium]